MFLFAWSLALNAVEYARRRRVARLIARFLREAALVNGRATLICRRSLRVRCHASGLRNSSQRLLDLLDQSKTELFIYENEAVEMLIKYENVFLQLDNWLLCPGYSHASVKYHKNRISFVVRLAALRRQSSIRTRRNSQRNNVEADGISASYSNSSNEKLKNESNTEGENSDFSETNTHCTEEEEEEENDECSGEESIPLPSTSIQSCLMEDESRAENLLYFLDDNAHLIAQHRKTRHLVYYESTLDAFHEIVFQWTEGKLFREDLLVEELYTVDLPPSDSMAFFGSAHSIASRQLSHDLTSLECDSSSTLSAASTQLVKLSRLSLASSSDAGTDPPYSLLEMLYLKELFGVNRHWNNFRSEIALDSATRRQHQHPDDHNSLIGWRSELAPFGIDHAARQMWRSLSPYESHQHFLLGTRSMLDTLPQRIQSLSPVRRRVTPAHSSDQSHDQVGGSASNTLVTRHRHCSARDEVEPAGRGANRSDNAINKRGGLDSPPSSSALTMEMVPNYFLRLRMTRYAEGDFGAMSFATRDDESVGTTSESETSVPPYGELRSDVENGDVLQINSDCPIGRKTSGKTTLTATTTSANCFADPDLASILKFEDQSCLSANATNGSTTTSTFGGIETPRHASMDETITHTLSELNNTDVVESANHFPAASNTFALADALEESVKFSAICRQNMQNQTIENVRNDCYYFVPTRNFARRSQNESTDSNASVRHVPRYSQISPMYEEVGACRSFTSNLTFHVSPTIVI